MRHLLKILKSCKKYLLLGFVISLFLSSFFGLFLFTNLSPHSGMLFDEGPLSAASPASLDDNFESYSSNTELKTTWTTLEGVGCNITLSTEQSHSLNKSVRLTDDSTGPTNWTFMRRSFGVESTLLYISLYVYLLQNDEDLIIYIINSGWGSTGIECGLANNGTVFYTSGGTYYWSDETYPANQWHHLEIHYDVVIHTYSFYFNKIPICEHISARSSISNPSEIVISTSTIYGAGSATFYVDDIYVHTSHYPIAINGNAELAAIASEGNGTADDPYILEDYVIATRITDTDRISISHTDAYFILRNSSVINANSPYGIKLFNVSNGWLANNTIHDGVGIGIYTVAAYNCKITNNLAYHNDDDGFYLYMSINCTLTRNHVYDNHYGIVLERSINCNLTNNQVLDNTYHGILLWSSNQTDNNRLINNTANENGVNGIHLHQSWGNYLAGNTANNNGGSGMDFSKSKNNTVLSNIANGNAEDGINLDSSSINNYIVDNTLLKNTYSVRGGLANIIENNSVIKTILPENKTYWTFPQSGFYQASFGFDSDASGTCPVGWDDVSSSGGSYVKVVSSKFGHKKVIEGKDTDDSGAFRINYYFSNTEGTIEFWIAHTTTQEAKPISTMILDSSDTVLFGIQLVENNIDIYANNSIISGGTYLKNTWYHFRLDYRSNSGTEYEGLNQNEFKLYINGTYKGIYEFYDLGDPDRLWCRSLHASSSYYGYWDAFGFSWDPNYDIGDNLNQKWSLSYVTNDADWVKYSLNGQDDITLSYDAVNNVWENMTIYPSINENTLQIFCKEGPNIYSSEVLHFTNYNYLTLEFINFTENGDAAPPGTRLTDDIDLNISATYRTSWGPLLTQTNASIYYKINENPWNGPNFLSNGYDYQASNFVIQKSNYSNGDDIYYFFRFQQYDVNGTLLKEHYQTQDGVKYHINDAQINAYHKRVESILYKLQLNYSVWYSAIVKNIFPTATGQNVSFYQWGHISYENITLSYQNLTSSLDNYSMASPTAPQLSHSINESTGLIARSQNPSFSVNDGIQSQFFINPTENYIEDVSEITIAKIDYEGLFSNHYLNFTGELINLTFLKREAWPYPYREVLTFISGLNMTVRFDSFTGIMLYYEHRWGNETSGRKLVMGLRENVENYPINLMVEKRTEIISGGFHIIPNSTAFILYDPPGDHSFSQITQGYKITVSHSFEAMNGTGWSSETLYGYEAAPDTGSRLDKWRPLLNLARDAVGKLFDIVGVEIPLEQFYNEQSGWETAAFGGLLGIGYWLFNKFDTDPDEQAMLEELYSTGQIQDGGEVSSAMVTEGTASDLTVEITQERTMTSSLNSEDPELIGPDRGDLYYGYSTVIPYFLVRDNYYIIINITDGPLIPLNDIYVWNEDNSTKLKYGYSTTAQFSVLGAYLDSYGLTGLKESNPFTDKVINSTEAQYVLKCGPSEFWTPGYVTEEGYSHSTTTTLITTLTNEFTNSSLEFQHTETLQNYESGLKCTEIVDQKFSNDIEYSYSVINTTSNQVNMEVLYHLEDDDGTPIGLHDQFCIDIYQDLRYGTFGFIVKENFTYTSNPYEVGTRDRRPPSSSTIYGLDEYVKGVIEISCIAMDNETGVDYVDFYISISPILDGTAEHIGKQNTPLGTNPNVYQLLWNTTDRFGLQPVTLYLFAKTTDCAIPLKNSLISPAYIIHIDNKIPEKCQAVAYTPLRGAIPLYASTYDTDSGIAYVEYWDGFPENLDSILLGVSYDPSSSYNFIWATNPSGADDGVHTIYARAYDNAGNYLDSLPLVIQVDNLSTPVATTDILLWAILGLGIVGISAYVLNNTYLRQRRAKKTSSVPPKKKLSTKPPPSTKETPLTILKHRLAKGEITRDEYHATKEMIEGK